MARVVSDGGGRQPDDAADEWPRLLHEPHHSWMLPKKQTGGRAKARETLLDFSSAIRVVVRERHEAVFVAEMAVAFWALPRCLQLVGDDKVFGLQRVKHHNLREN
jgi:hypothetical protein